MYCIVLMKATDIFLVIIIVCVFISIIVFNQVSVSLTQLKDQWPVIRCNPLAMPFASLFDVDTSTNFTYCVQDMQSKFMSHLLKPLDYNFGVVGELSSSVLGSLDSIRNFILKMRTFISDIMSNIFGVFLNILIEFQRLTLNIKDMIFKLVGVMSVVLFTLDGTMKTMLSVWNGPPGQIVRRF